MVRYLRHDKLPGVSKLPATVWLPSIGQAGPFVPSVWALTGLSNQRQTLDSAGMRDLDELAAAVLAAFTRVHREVFIGDPAANPRLPVDVLEPLVVEGMPTMVLLTPWTLNGLFFPVDGVAPEQLTVAGRPRPVFAAELDHVGPYYSVNLVPDVSGLPSPERGRALARACAAPFQEAVRQLGTAAEIKAPSVVEAG